MKLPCNNARSLVPSYLDGELSEEQCAPLRSHLLQCPECRESAKQGKAIRRWFSEGTLPAVAVPQGFAARVARRAFAGDTGSGWSGDEAEPERTLLPFVLRVCAVAAAVLFCFSIALQRRSLPEESGLDAQYLPPWEKEVQEDLQGPPPPVEEPEPEGDEEGQG